MPFRGAAVATLAADTAAAIVAARLNPELVS
jgi:hypothetical protein